MQDLAAVLTPEGLLAAVVAGIVFGASLPALLERLLEGLIPDDQIDVLNASAGVFVPLLAIPLGGAFWLAQIVTEAVQGGPWPRLVGRFLIFVVYVLVVTVADLGWQRVRAALLVARTDARASASEMRVAELRRVSVTAEMRRTEQAMRGKGR